MKTLLSHIGNFGVFGNDLQFDTALRRGGGSECGANPCVETLLSHIGNPNLLSDNLQPPRGLPPGGGFEGGVDLYPKTLFSQDAEYNGFCEYAEAFSTEAGCGRLKGCRRSSE